MTRKVCFCFAVLFYTHTVYAQDQKGFFDNNFVHGKEPVQQETVQEAVPAAPIEPLFPEMQKEKPDRTKKEDMGFIDLGGDDMQVLPRKKSGKVDKDLIIPAAIDSGEPVEGIELILSTEDDLKFETYLNTYIRLLATREVDSKGVGIILKKGDPAEYMQLVITVLNNALSSDAERKAAALTEEDLAQMKPDEAQALLAQVAQSPLLAKRIQSTMLTRVLWDMPPEYGIKKVPSWILHTEKGVIILEGIDDPSEMITKNGKFIDPQGVEEEKKKASKNSQ